MQLWMKHDLSLSIILYMYFVGYYLLEGKFACMPITIIIYTHVTCRPVKIWRPSWVFQVIDQMMTGMASIYDIPHYHSTGHLCKTNIPSSTAMRGFGLPQAHFVIQTMMFDIAKHLNMSFNKVSKLLWLRKTSG